MVWRTLYRGAVIALGAYVIQRVAYTMGYQAHQDGAPAQLGWRAQMLALAAGVLCYLAWLWLSRGKR